MARRRSALGREVASATPEVEELSSVEPDPKRHKPNSPVIKKEPVTPSRQAKTSTKVTGKSPGSAQLSSTRGKSYGEINLAEPLLSVSDAKDFMHPDAVALFDQVKVSDFCLD
jgi:hypothetical protein